MLASAMQISRKVCCAVICYPKPALLLSQSLLYRLTALYLCVYVIMVKCITFIID